MLGAVDSERIKSPHYLFVTGNADSENTEKCKTKSQVLVNAVKIHQSKGTENGRLWREGVVLEHYDVFKN